MRFFLIALFALYFPLSAFSANRLTECTFGIGYRGDRIHTEGASFQVKEQSLHSLLETFRLETLAQNLLLSVVLDYGILLQGKRSIENPLPNSPPLSLSFNQDYGYEVDVSPKIGYSFSLSNSALQCNFLTSLGYGYSRISLREKGLGEASTPTNQQVFFDTKSFLYEWFGPFLEAKLDIFQFSVWKFSLAYQYHFIHGKTKQPIFLQETALDASLLVQQMNQSTTLHTKVSSGSKQVGEVAIFYLPIRRCTIGFESAVSYTSSHKAVQKGTIQNDVLSSTLSSTSFQTSVKQDVKQTAFSLSVLLSVLLWF